MDEMNQHRRTILKAGLLVGVGGTWSGLRTAVNPDTRKKLKKLPGGFWPVMMTPFTGDLKIDYSGLERLIKWYERAGASGFFANCASSEMYQLDAAERLELTRFVVEHTRLPVVSTGTFYPGARENAEYIKKISDTGVKAVVMIPSVMVEESTSDDELLKVFENILDMTGKIPLGIYECPGPYHRLVNAELLSKLNDSGRFLYFKDTSCNAEAVDKKIEKTSGSRMSIYNAYSPDALHFIQQGGAGVSCIAGNYYPELFSYICQYGRKDVNSTSTAEVNQFILDGESVINRKYPLASKYFMNLRGLGVNVNSRKGTAPLDQNDEKKLNLLWNSLQELAQKHKIKLA